MAKTSSPPITTLNADILQEIFLYFSKYELLDVAVVCAEWNSVAQGLIDRRMEIVASEKMQGANLRVLRRCREEEGLRRRVRGLVVREWHLDDLPLFRGDPHRAIEDPWMPGKYFSTTYVDEIRISRPSQELISAICQALEVMDLQSFTWSAVRPVPAALFERLLLHPSCGLHIRRNERAYEAAIWTYSPMLNHIQVNNISRLKAQLVTLEIFLPPDDKLLLGALGRLIASSPRLKRLKVYSLGKLWGGSSVPLNLRLGRGCIYTPVCSLQWLSAPVTESGKLLRLDELELDNFCVCGLDGGHLSSIVDLSSLRSLGLSCFSCLGKNANRPSLRSFRLHCYNPEGELDPICSMAWSVHDVRHMLSRCRSITALYFMDGNHILNEPLLERVGSRLTSLRLHETVPSISNAALDLGPIKHYCQNLEDISLDAPGGEMFNHFSAGLGAALTKCTRLALSRDQEAEIFIDPFTPSPRLHSTILADMPELWERVVTDKSRPTELVLQFVRSTPWDRDKRFIFSGRLHAFHPIASCRTYLAQGHPPKKPGCTSQQDNHAKCLEVEQADRAIRHGWQWLESGDETGWEERLQNAKQMATEGHPLFARLIPNAAGEFTQQMM